MASICGRERQCVRCPEPWAHLQLRARRQAGMWEQTVPRAPCRGGAGRPWGRWPEIPAPVTEAPPAELCWVGIWKIRALTEKQGRPCSGRSPQDELLSTDPGERPCDTTRHLQAAGALPREAGLCLPLVSSGKILLSHMTRESGSGIVKML